MLFNSKNPKRALFGVRLLCVLCVLLTLGVLGFGMAAFYLGCTGAWSALWPGFLSLFMFIGLYTMMEISKSLSAGDDKLQNDNTTNVKAGSSENTINNENLLSDAYESTLKNQLADAKKSKISGNVIVLILHGVLFALWLTLGLLNVINLTFALSLAIHIAMSGVLWVLGMYCGNKVKNLYPRFIYASGLVATVTFAFLIAFKVVSLATIAPFVAPSLAFAFLCFVYCVIQRCKGKGCCCCINSVMPEEGDKAYNNIEKGKNKDHNLKLDDSLNFEKSGYEG